MSVAAERRRQKEKPKAAEVVQQNGEAIEEDDDEEVLKIQQLEGNGITSADLQKLREAGLHTVSAVAFAPKKMLLAVRPSQENKPHLATMFLNLSSLLLLLS